MVIVAPDREDNHPAFGPIERAIFAYELGSAAIAWHGDPLAIENRLQAGLARVDMAALQSWLSRKNPTVRLRGLQRWIPILRAAFALPEFDEADPAAGVPAWQLLQVLTRFLNYQDHLRAKWRREAELIATYGRSPNRGESYECEVGLFLNRERVQALAAVAHWWGALAASGVAQAHFSLVDAMASSEAQAHEMAAALESDRVQAEAEARQPR